MTGLVFKHGTWSWVVWESPHSGEPKTQTRRLVLPSDEVDQLYDPSIVYHSTARERLALKTSTLPGIHVAVASGRRAKWQVGQSYAVMPDTNEPAVMRKGRKTFVSYGKHEDVSAREWKKNLEARGYIEARVRITSIMRTDVRAMSYRDIEAEGYSDPLTFWKRWIADHDLDAFPSWKAALASTGPFDPERVPLYNPDRPTNHTREVPIAQDLDGVYHARFLSKRPPERYQAWVLDFKLTRE